MDLMTRNALRNFRMDNTPESALELVRAMDLAGLMPDSSLGAGGGLLTCDLDDKGNATAHVTIGMTNLLLFHRTVVGVQTVGQPAVVNEDWCNTPTTRKRIREWPHARHRTAKPEGRSFNDPIRFRPF